MGSGGRYAESDLERLRLEVGGREFVFDEFELSISYPQLDGIRTGAPRLEVILPQADDVLVDASLHGYAVVVTHLGLRFPCRIQSSMAGQTHFRGRHHLSLVCEKAGPEFVA